MKSLVSDIQKCSVNDGPGIRTAVFLKGCNMRCTWCHNPETVSFEKQIFWNRRLCTQPGICYDVCPENAINLPIPPEEAQAEGSTYQKIIRDRCTLCMECVTACPQGAFEISGKEMSVEDVLNVVQQDQLFYDNSGGGLTLSGGELTSHQVFARALLQGAKKRHLHIAIDTNGHCDWPVLEELAGMADVVLFDIKHLDNEAHKKATGVGNKKVLANLERLSQTGVEIWVRIPVIPDLTNSVEYQVQVADFLAGLTGKISRVDLIPYHNWCQSKYDWLGEDWGHADNEAIEPGELEKFRGLYESKGLRVVIGGSGFATTN